MRKRDDSTSPEPAIRNRWPFFAGINRLPCPTAAAFRLPLSTGRSNSTKVRSTYSPDPHRVYLYSDGIVEQFDAAGKDQFGTERLLQCLTSRHAIPAEQAAAEVVSELTTWAGSNRFTDDVSLVVIEWLGDPAGK